MLLGAARVTAAHAVVVSMGVAVVLDLVAAEAAAVVDTTAAKGALVATALFVAALVAAVVV
jgi:hypothetical protein